MSGPPILAYPDSPGGSWQGLRSRRPGVFPKIDVPAAEPVESLRGPPPVSMILICLPIVVDHPVTETKNVAEKHPEVVCTEFVRE